MANCRFHGSMKGCRKGVYCSFSHANPNSVPLCLYQNNQCRYGFNCMFRHESFSVNPIISAIDMDVSILILDLPLNIIESNILEIFNAVGPIEHIRILRNKETRKSLGFAIVRYYSVQDAERAFDTLNFMTIHSMTIRTIWSKHYHEIKHDGFKQANNIFLCNMHQSIDNKTLYDTFSVFGDIFLCKVFDDKKGNNFGTAFVCFADPKSAIKAVDGVNGMKISDRTIYAEILQLETNSDDKDIIVKKNELGNISLITKKLISLDLYTKYLQQLFDENTKCIKTIQEISNVDKILMNPLNDIYANDLNKCKFLIDAFVNTVKHNNIPLEIINLLISFYYINGNNIEITIIGSDINTQKAIWLIDVGIINQIQKQLSCNNQY